MKKSIISKSKTTSVVNQNEEITIREEENISIKKSQDEFYQVYHEFLQPLINLTGKERAVLDFMCKNVTYNTGIIDLSTYVRKELCEYVGVKTNNLSTLLKNLERSQAIRKIGSGRYMLNGLMFWKGENEKRIEEITDFYVTFEVIKEVPVEDQKELLNKSKISQIKRIHFELSK